MGISGRVGNETAAVFLSVSLYTKFQVRRNNWFDKKEKRLGRGRIKFE